MVITSISVRAFIDIAPTGAIFIQNSLKLLLRTGFNWLDILIAINMICNEYYKALYNESSHILLEKIIHGSHRIYLQLLDVCIYYFVLDLHQNFPMQLSRYIIDATRWQLLPSLSEHYWCCPYRSNFHSKFFRIMMRTGLNWLGVLFVINMICNES